MNSKKKINYRYIKITFFVLIIIFLFGVNKIYSQNQIIKSIDFVDKQEIAASIGFDGKKIVFVGYKETVPLFYEATLNENDEWNNVTPLDDINNYKSDAYIGTPVYNFDASRLYFEADYNIDSSGIDIFYSDRTLTGWTQPQSIGIPVNSLGYDGEPSISADGLSLFFVRQNIENQDINLNCKKIYVASKNSEGFWNEPSQLPEPINLVCERSPRILADNKTLLFSSIREGGKGGYDLYYAKQLTKNVWLLPTPLDTINSEFNEIYPSISFFGDDLIFSIVDESKKKVKGNVYYNSIPSQFKPDKNILLTGKISDLNTGLPVNSTITVYNPNNSVVITEITNDHINGIYSLFLPLYEEFLVDFTSTGYSHVYQNINTTDFDESISINQDITLYNKVNLLLNVFDKEIFQPQNAKIAVKDTNNHIIENINVSKLDIGRFDLTLPVGNKYFIEIQKTYFETFILEFDLSGVILFDEFERDIELSSKKQKIEFTISDAESKDGIQVDIEVTNLSTNEKYKVVATTDANGKAYLELREGDTYEINMSPKGYAFYNTTLNLEDEEFENKIEVELTPLTEETKFELQNITFETNSAALNSSSYVELNRVILLMENNPDIKIEISAHTDNVGSDAYNLKLSDKRAQSVVDFLNENGVNIERLIAKGYGETVPLFQNDTDENKSKNRRVELKIIEI